MNNNSSPDAKNLLLLTVVCLLLSTLGFCGKDCQQTVQHGIRTTSKALQGE